LSLIYLSSFPTRRSSDLENVILGTGNDTLTTDTGLMGTINGGGGADVVNLGKGGAEYVNLGRDADEIILSALADKELVVSLNGRSEEHTSELQSRENLVC